MRVVIADDHELFISGLSSIFNQDNDIEVVDTVSNGSQLAKILAKHRAIDLILLDLNMPLVNGINFLKSYPKADTRPKVLVLSFYKDEKLINKAIQEGADGYLSKDADASLLVQTMWDIVRGDYVFSKEAILGDQQGYKSLKDDFIRQNRLSGRELEIIQEVKAGLNSAEIATKLSISEFTVNTHRRNILKKMDARNFTELLSRLDSI